MCHWNASEKAVYNMGLALIAELYGLQGLTDSSRTDSCYLRTAANAQCTPADWESAFVGRCVPNADPIVGANRRYSADSKFESALEPVGTSRRCVPNADPIVGANRQVCIDF